MKNVIAYAENGIYAGWPANHGGWQWGDEFLVGFMRGAYKRQSMHNIIEPFELMQARSLDGGETWATETPNIPVDYYETNAAPEFSLKDAIIRVRGTYDHGGDCLPPGGGFWLSRNRGRVWSGPFGFDGLVLPPEQHLTARTCTLGDLVFLSKAQIDFWGTDDVFAARHDGKRFSVAGIVCDDNARAVMPAVAMVGDRIVCTMRRRKNGRRDGWIDAFGSEDGGESWRFLSEVGVTGSQNGNPPALIASGDRLICAYGNRDECAILARESFDGGKTWSLAQTLRDGGKSDIGYPRLFLRSDGKAVCVYYWAENNQQHIAATIF